MSMRLSHAALALAALATAACPEGRQVLGNNGFGIGSSGGGGADVLAFTVQPTGAAAGNIMTPAIQVTVKDTLGTPDSAFTASVSVVLGSNLVGGTLSGTTSVTPVNGVAVFGDLIIDKGGTGYTLRASAPGASAATSNAFSIN